MTIESILKTLGLNYPGTYVDDNVYEIDLHDSDTFGKAYQKLESNNDVDELDDLTDMSSADDIKVAYTYNNYMFILEANMLDDEYTLTINQDEDNDEENSERD